MRMRIDESETSCVVTCPECPHWSAFTWTREAALESIKGHKINVHGMEPNKAAEALRTYRRRHAAA